MPPRRRTFYLADATVLSNGKVRRLARQHPDDWIAAWGAFHLLIGVATLNGHPRLSDDDMIDTLGSEHARLAEILRDGGLLTRTGIDPATFRDWCPRPRPKYPSDYRGIPPTTAESDTITTESPTSSTTSTSSTESTAPSPSVSRGVAPSAKGRANGINPQEERRRALEHLSEEYKAGRLSEVDYERERRVLAS